MERSGEASAPSIAPSIHEKEEARFSSPQNVEDAQVADGSHVSTRGTKRAADEQLEPEPESLDVGESRKRPLENDGDMLDSVGVCVTDDCSGVHGIMQLSEGFTGADMFFEDQSLQSVVYQGGSKSETVSFCGSSIKVWKPDYAVDDSTSNTLDVASFSTRNSPLFAHATFYEQKIFKCFCVKPCFATNSFCSCAVNFCLSNKSGRR